MEKEKFNLGRYNKYVKKALVFIGYPENIQVKLYYGNGIRDYVELIYEQYVNGKMEKYLLSISLEQYFDMFKYGMELDGYDVKLNRKMIIKDQYYFMVGYEVKAIEVMKKRKRLK